MTTGFDREELIEELFESLLHRYELGLEQSMGSSEFMFDYIDELNYKCHKISLNRGVSYIDFPHWLKNKKATINSKNNSMCFKYVVTVEGNHD